MICSAVAFHTNGFGSVFQCSAHSVIAAVRSATLVNTPWRSRLSFSSLNQRSIRLSHELEVGVKCKCQRRRVLVRQPLLHLGRGVGIRGRRWCPSPDLRCPFEHDCDSTGERERRSYRVWPRKCLLRPGPAEPMTSAARLPTTLPVAVRLLGAVRNGRAYVLDSPASARKTPTRGCQGTTALTSASAPRPVAAPCCGGWCEPPLSISRSSAM
jgi:hypothetical protein